MANQPSKYSKFLVGAASAALVASAVAPVASAADFKDTKGNTHEEAINALSDSGVIKGYSDGTFLPNKTLTRSDVVKMMGKWLVTEGATIPADARTNPRFTDLSTKTNAELLDYAAVVKDAGVFIGSNGKLLATDNITRENMALVLVRAFDTVNEINLVEYVNAQEFKKDVKDLNAAKKEAQDAINVLDFFDITNPAVASFNPKGNTTRGHFATFLNKSINTDFSLVSGVVTGAVKAINATTVEVTFKDAVSDVKASDFTIEGLTISNATVKQTNDKVVVLTTSAQTGDKEYTVKQGDSTLGTFKGISAVVPTTIKLASNSVQAKVGAEVTLKADIGIKAAGVPVTFNVDAATDSLNKDQVVEVYTDANGIAEYSYTQYNAGSIDNVSVYPTGAPATRDVAIVFWGVDTILALTADDEKGNTVTNGANKVYKVTYKDAKTGKPVDRARINVTFKENIDVNVDKLTKATVNGVNPHQLSNGSTPSEVEVVTNSKGEATFTVTGTNTKATPVVFLDVAGVNGTNNKLDSSELQVSAEQLTFAAEQVSNDITITRDGSEEATIGDSNGRKYKVAVKTKDGKVAAGEIVNVALNENIDRVITTETDAVIRDASTADGYVGEFTTPSGLKQVALRLDSKGEAEFRVTSSTPTAYATPVAWIDINSSNAVEGNLDEGEATKVADITYFATEKVTSGSLKNYNGTTETSSFKGNEIAKFVFAAANQSGRAVADQPALNASYTVFNTGLNDIKVGTQTVSPNRSFTVTVPSAAGIENAIFVTTADKTSSVRVEANATTVPATGSTTAPVYLGNKTATATFVSTSSVSDFYTGQIVSINTDDEKIYFAGKSDAVSYKDAAFTATNGSPITETGFKALLAADQYTATYTKAADGKVKIDLISIASATATPGLATNDGSLVFTSTGTNINSIPVAAIAVTDADLNTNPFTVDTATVTVKDAATGSVVVTLTETGVNTGVFKNTAVVNLTTLADGAITVTYSDAANSAGVTAPVVSGIATLDKTAATLSAITGTVAALATTEATLAFTSTEAGTYYYVAYAAAETAPTVDEVIAQGTAVAKGTAPATASANSVSVTGLTTATAYKAYVVVVDATGNKSALGTTATFTTN